MLFVAKRKMSKIAFYLCIDIHMLGKASWFKMILTYDYFGSQFSNLHDTFSTGGFSFAHHPFISISLF